MLTDSYGRVATDLRVSLTDRCNLRCAYCMPPEGLDWLPTPEVLTADEIVRLLTIGVEMLGIREVRFTGGEPLLRRDLADIIARTAALGPRPDISLTTNGIGLDKRATALKAAGLDRINVSLDTLRPEVFRKLTHRDRLADVLDGLAAAAAAGLTPVKINAVIERGLNDHTALDLLERFRGSPVIVRFIEFMDVGNRNQWRPELVVPSRELAARIHERWPMQPISQNYQGEVAKRWRFDDGGGEVGFISSVSQPFCGACSRARLSSEGKFYTCLFATQGLDLRAPLRAGAEDAEVLKLIRGVWANRTDRYSELREELRRASPATKKIEMNYIGG